MAKIDSYKEIRRIYDDYEKNEDDSENKLKDLVLKDELKIL